MTSEFQPEVVMPGESLAERISEVSTDVKVGVGIASKTSRASGTNAATPATDEQQPGVTTITATKAGVLRFRKKNKFWIESNQKRYVPAMDDVVIGVVSARHTEGYKVDLGSSSMAILDSLAFDGASKRNKPNLQIGDVVYARVTLAHRDIEPEISCAVSDKSTKKMDWVTGKSTYGQLHGGNLFRCSLGLCRRLRSTKNENVLDVLGTFLAFEVVLGCNGYVYVHSNSARHTILVSNAILNSEHLPHAQVVVMVRALVNSLRMQEDDDE